MVFYFEKAKIQKLKQLAHGCFAYTEKDMIIADKKVLCHSLLDKESQI